MKQRRSSAVGVRIAVPLLVVGLLASAAAGYLLLARHARLREEGAQRWGRLGSHLVRVALPVPRRPRRPHDWATLGRELAPAGLPAGLLALRVFDDQGRVVASSQPDEVGQAAPDGAGRALREWRSGTASPVLGGVQDRLTLPPSQRVLHPLWASGRCGGACHRGGEQRLLGGLELVVDRTHLDAGVGGLQELAGATWLGLVVGLVLLAGVLAHALLGRPLDGLTRALRRAEGGDFLVRAPETGGREVAGLARSFNALMGRITDLKVDVVDTRLELQTESGLSEQLEARQAALQDANLRLRERAAHLELLHGLSRVVSSSLELDRVLAVVAERLSTAVGVPRVALALVEPDGVALCVCTAHGFPEPERIVGLRLSSERGIAWEALNAGEPVVVEDTRDDPRVTYFRGRLRDEGTLAAVPFQHRDEDRGVLLLARPDGRSFTAAELLLARTAADQVALVVSNARLHEQAHSLAITDELTGLYNRRYLGHRLRRELDRARRFANPLSLLLIDLDRFKEYNATNGHLFGDRVLAAVAELLRERLRGIDTVARYGGEEFVVLLPHTPRAEALQVAEGLRQAVAEHPFPPVAGSGAPSAAPAVQITASIGVAALPCERDLDPEAVLAAADAALYQAKRSQRDRVYVADLAPEPTEGPNHEAQS